MLLPFFPTLNYNNSRCETVFMHVRARAYIQLIIMLANETKSEREERGIANGISICSYITQHTITMMIIKEAKKKDQTVNSKWTNHHVM